MDDLMQCPYNSAHRIIHHRMPYHIVKCKKNYCGPPMESCVYNAMHIVPVGDMNEHIRNCIDAHIVNRERYEKQYLAKYSKQA